jgi:hypothetical protein
MQKQRKLTDKTRGMFAGPRGMYGQNVEGNSALTSGITYGGQGLGWFWQQYPGVTGGLTRYDPQALQPGSNLSAVQQGAKSVAKDAGRTDGKPTGASVGGTAGY